MELIYYALIGVTLLVVGIGALIRFLRPPSWKDGEDPAPRNIFEAFFDWWKRHWWWSP
ncbi:MAG: hypothetical protein QM758_08595 [Armatimonas sp.]